MTIADDQVEVSSDDDEMRRQAAALLNPGNDPRVFEPDLVTNSNANESQENCPEVKFSVFDFFFTGLSCILYLFNVSVDGYLACVYCYFMEWYWYSILTLFFIVIPATAMSIFTLFEYLNERKFSFSKKYPLPSTLQWVYRIVGLVFCISPLPCYAETIYYGFKYNKELEEEAKAVSQPEGFPVNGNRKTIIGRYVVLLYVNRRTTALLRLIDGFLGRAPQIILQLHILALTTDNIDSSSSFMHWQYASVSVSIVSLAWAVASFLPMRILYTTEAEEPCIIVSVFSFLSHFFGISSRAVVIFLFAAAVHWIVWPVVIMYHFLVVFNAAEYLTPKIQIRMLEYKDDSKTNESWWERLRLSMYENVVFMFTLMHSNKLRHGRRNHVLCFVENVFMIAIWFTWSLSNEQDWHQYVALASHFVLFGTAYCMWKKLQKYESQLNEIATLLTTEEKKLNSDEQGPYLDAKFKLFDLVKLVIALVVQLSDVATDSYLALKFYHQADYWYFGLTLGFVLLPAFVTAVRNFIRYVKSFKNSSCLPQPHLPQCIWYLRIICSTIFPLSSVPSYIEKVIYGIQYEMAKKLWKTGDMQLYFNAIENESGVVMLNQLVEASIESAPQLILQLYIKTVIEWPNGVNWTTANAYQVFSMLVSVISLGWALTSWRLDLMKFIPGRDYLKKFLDHNKRDLINTIVLQTFAHYMSIALRAFLIVYLAKAFGWHMLWVFIAAHVAFILLLSFGLSFKVSHVHTIHMYVHTENGQRNLKTLSQVEFVFLLLLGAIVTIFSYFHNNRTFRRWHYYVIWCLENAVAIYLLLKYYLKLDESAPLIQWVQIFLMIAMFILVFGIFFFAYQNIKQLKTKARTQMANRS